MRQEVALEDSQEVVLEVEVPQEVEEDSALVVVVVAEEEQEEAVASQEVVQEASQPVVVVVVAGEADEEDSHGAGASRPHCCLRNVRLFMAFRKDHCANSSQMELMNFFPHKSRKSNRVQNTRTRAPIYSLLA